MLVLAVESVTDAAAVALADENGALGSLVVARGRRHTETIAPAIEALCRRVGVTLADLHLLAVDVGPGLFTGLRVGVGTVKALSFALDLPVVTATSLEILAHAVTGAGVAPGRLVVPVVDARRAEVFSARFRSPSGDPGQQPGGAGSVEGTATVTATGDENARAVWAPEALAADLGALSEPFVVAGDGALRYHSLFASLPGATVLGPAYAAPPVTALAELAVARGLAGQVHQGATVMPRYLRQADARINWEQRLAPPGARPGRRVTMGGGGSDAGGPGEFGGGDDAGPTGNGGPGRRVAGAVRIAPFRRRHLRSVVRIEEAAYPRPWSAALFLSELAQRSRRYTVGSIGPIVVGYAGLMVVDEDGHVTTLTVDPGWHHRGVGTVLLADLARAAPALGVRHLTLEVRVGNAPAQALYRRFGFAPVGVRKNYYAETGEDAIIMWARDVDTPAYGERLAAIDAHLGATS